MIKLILIKIFTFILLGSSLSIPAIAKDAIENDITQLKWVEGADPLADANKAIIAKNYSLLAIQGYTWTIPGVPEEHKYEYRNKYGIKIIKGTSDVVLNSEHARLIQLATEYARKYNLHILSHQEK